VKVAMMAEDKADVGAQDRARVSSSNGYDGDYFAKKHGLTAADARELIIGFGNIHKELDAAAEKLKRCT
jgi:hypothetical protein